METRPLTRVTRNVGRTPFPAIVPVGQPVGHTDDEPGRSRNRRRYASVMRVLMPLPDRDFDVTEVAVPWYVLTAAGHDVVFAGERAGASLAADPRLLGGVVFGRLGAQDEPKR